MPETDVTSDLVELDARLGLSAFEPEQGGGPSAPRETRTADETREPASAARRLVPVRFGSLTSREADAVDEGSVAVREGREVARASDDVPVRVPLGATRDLSGRRWTTPLAAVAALLAIVASLAIWFWGPSRVAMLWAGTGELAVASTPPGARVIIGGTDRGTTPLTASLAAGAYELELRADGERVVLPVQVKAGATTAQHVFLRSALPASAGGRLQVTSDPPKATVVIDGKIRGVTPVVVTDLQPGGHDIVVAGTTGRVRQRVEVQADATTTVMVPLPRRSAGQSAGGWLSVRAPLELRIFDEAGRLVGTSAMRRLSLPAGPQTLRLTNEAAGVDVTRQVSIGGGQTATLEVALPPGTLSVNALPWAQVSIDGRDVGETPLGGIELPPGPHEVVFRHPDLGERRQPVTVRAGAHSRLSTDLRR